MITLEQLCNKINLQPEITEKVTEFDLNCDYSCISGIMKGLFSRETWVEARREIKVLLGEDIDGIKILTCMLKCGIETYEMYSQKGIDEKIFIETMKAFTRFIDEHKVSYGNYAFDRDWWTARQISMQLLRIGELEYEMKSIDGEKVISLHIPSDAVITKEMLHKSYDMAKSIFDEYFPEYAGVKMVCSSWLLSPSLKKVLNEGSRILYFQSQFDIKSVNYEETEFMEWIFKNPNIPMAELPQNTTLQRNLKNYLIDGGKVGSAFGVLIEPAFE